jgi:hypothetical protein
MSAPIPTPVACKCGSTAHPARHVSEHGCPSCSLAIAQTAIYADHRALLRTSPDYAKIAAERERAYYHPPTEDRQ